jgi:hypothetical protein
MSATPGGPTALTKNPDRGIGYPLKGNERKVAEYLHLDLAFNSSGATNAGETAAYNCGGTSVRLRIEPEDSVMWFERKKHLEKKHGRFVARITNVDAVDCSTFSIKPNEHAYLWIGTDKDSNTVVSAYKVYREKKKWQVARVAKGDFFMVCAGDTPTGSEARWTKTHNDADCERVGARPGKPIPLHDHDDAWISCVGGCCRVGGLLQVDPGEPEPGT